MPSTLDQVLDQRLHRVSRGQRGRYLASSVAAHALLSLVAFALPVLFREPPEQFDYVAVTVVPPQALGIDDPNPQAARVEPEPQPPPPPPPQPEPEQPQAEPPPPDRPVLIKDEPKKPERDRPAKEPAPPPPAPAPASRPVARDQPAKPASPLTRRKGSPFGNPLGSTNDAALQGVEDPNFTYGYYLDRVVAVISQNWVRPPVGGDVVQAVLYFRIQAGGQVTDLRIKESSGNDSFDQAALRALEASSPLPPLPRSYKRDHLGINLIVR